MALKLSEPPLAIRRQPDAPGPRKTGRSIALAALLVAGIAGGVAVVRLRDAKHPSGVDVVRDVPRLEGSTIVFSTAYRERAGLTFAKVERVPFKPIVRVVGAVSFNPSYMAAVGTRLRGTVRRTFKYEGDKVSANEALAEVESAELGEAQATIAQAEATQTSAEVHARREQDLLAKGLTTAREAEVATTELLTTRASLQAARQRVKSFGGNGAFGVFVLRTPIAGHVIAHHISPGQSVDSNVVGYKVADLDHLWVELSVFERDIAAVHVDDEVDIAPLAELTHRIAGRVAHVGEVIDETTRSTAVRVEVDYPKHHLRVGQSVQATITSATATHDALLIPAAAVIFVDGKATVFVSESDTKARAVAVRLGGSDGERHEVLEGVAEGQRVAISGVFALKSELFR